MGKGFASFRRLYVMLIEINIYGWTRFSPLTLSTNSSRRRRRRPPPGRRHRGC